MSWLGAILQGTGRAGNEVAQSKELRLDQEQKKLELLKSQLGLSEIRQKLTQGAAPQFIGSHAGPSGQLFNTTRDPQTGNLTDQFGGKESPKGIWKSLLQEDGTYVEYNDATGESRGMKDETGKPIRGFPKGKNGPLMIAGKPGGIIRNGQPITPDSPEWTDSDAVQYASYLRTYAESNKDKDKRIELAAKSRTASYLATRQYAAMDAQNGSLVYVTPADIAKSPGRYAPAGPAVAAKTRTGIFQDLDVAQGFLSESISKLPNDAFDPAARLQIAAALRSSDPQSAFHEFMDSNYAATLSDPQVEYVTALVNMQESALALRSIAGMGQGSDKMRDAITKMLPGAGTPSKAYALRQLQLFKAEVNALRTTVPGIGEPGQGGGGTQSTSGGKIIKVSPEDMK